jgi:hypothetical protein
VAASQTEERELLEVVGGRRRPLAADKRVWKAIKLSQCSKMARLAVLRASIISGVRRRELASCWRQHSTAQAESTAARPERILESPFRGKTRVPELTLTEFVWQDVEQWLSKPAVVCTATTNEGFTSTQHLSLHQIHLTFELTYN